MLQLMIREVFGTMIKLVALMTTARLNQEAHNNKIVEACDVPPHFLSLLSVYAHSYIFILLISLSILRIFARRLH